MNVICPFIFFERRRRHKEILYRLEIDLKSRGSKDKKLYDVYKRIRYNEDTRFLSFLLVTRNRKHVLGKLKELSKEELKQLVITLNNYIFHKNRSNIRDLTEQLRNGEKIHLKEDDIWLLFYVLDTYLEVREITATVDELFSIDWGERKNRDKRKIKTNKQKTLRDMIREKWRTYRKHRDKDLDNFLGEAKENLDNGISANVPNLKKKEEQKTPYLRMP